MADASRSATRSENIVQDKTETVESALPRHTRCIAS